MKQDDNFGSVDSYESIVAQALSEAGKASAKDIALKLHPGDPDLRKRTAHVSVTLKRLEAKGLVRRAEKVGRSAFYESVNSQEMTTRPDLVPEVSDEKGAEPDIIGNEKLVLEQLKSLGESSAVDITALLSRGSTQVTAVCLKRLAKKGIVERTRKVGRKTYYRFKEPVEVAVRVEVTVPQVPELEPRNVEGTEKMVLDSLHTVEKASASELAAEIYPVYADLRLRTSQVYSVLKRLEAKGHIIKISKVGRNTYFAIRTPQALEAVREELRPLQPLELPKPRFTLPRFAVPSRPMLVATATTLAIIVVAFNPGVLGLFVKGQDVLMLSLDTQQMGDQQLFSYVVRNADVRSVGQMTVMATLPQGSSISDSGGASVEQVAGATLLEWSLDSLGAGTQHVFSFAGTASGHVSLSASALASQETPESLEPKQMKLEPGQREYVPLNLVPKGYLSKIAMSLAAASLGTELANETVPPEEYVVPNVTENVTQVPPEPAPTEEMPVPEENATVPSEEAPAETPTGVTPEVFPTGAVTQPETSIEIYIDPDGEINGNEDLIGNADYGPSTFDVELPKGKYVDGASLVLYASNGATVRIDSIDVMWIEEVVVNATETVEVTPNATQNVTQNITENVTQNVTQNLTQNITQNVTQNITENLTEVTVSVHDAQGAQVDADVSLEDANGRSIKEEKNAGILAAAPHKFKVEGASRVRVAPKETAVKELSFSGISGNVSIGLDALPSGTEGPQGANWSQGYAIDPSAFEFSSGSATVTAQGTVLFKCKDWSFAAQTCNGSWEELMGITPGENYALALSAGDPAFLEYNFSARVLFGHTAWMSGNAAAQPPTGGPSVANEAELTAWNYSAISLRDTMRANVSTANFKSIRFQYKLNYTIIQIINITAGWEGYASAVGSRPVIMYMWNWTSGAWITVPSQSNTSDGLMQMTMAGINVNHTVNASGYVIVLAESADPSSASAIITNYANISVWADSAPPWTSGLGQNTSTPAAGEAVMLYATCQDDYNLSQAVLETNETGAFLNKSTYGSPDDLSGTSSSANFTWQNGDVQGGTVVSWRIYLNDSAGNANSTGLMNFTTGTDTSIPRWYSNQSDASAVGAGHLAFFNVTWNDTESSIHTALIEHNFTGTPINETMNNLVGSVYQFSTTIPVGSYYWKSYANDTQPNYNSTPKWNFTVAQSDPTSMMDILVNGSSSNSLWYQYGKVTNVTAYFNWTGADDAEFFLYRNDFEFDPSTLVTDVRILAGGNHTYVYNTTGGENYTAGSVTRLLNITKAISNVTLFLNGTQASRNYQLGQQANLTVAVNATGQTVWLHTNMTGWSDISGTTPFKSYNNMSTEGVINVTGYLEENENYTADSQTYFATVVNAPYVTLNSPESGATQYGGTTLNCTAEHTAGLSAITLYWNYTGAWLANGTVDVSGATATATFTRPRLQQKAFAWNCFANNTANASAFASANSTFTVANAYMRYNTTWSDPVADADYAITIFGDIDNDGDPDLFVAGYDGAAGLRRARVYENENGNLAYNSTWSTTLQILGATGGGAFVDIDRDGDLDLFYCGYTGADNCMMYINTGTTFTETDAWDKYVNNTREADFKFADVDNDGDMDLIKVGYKTTAPAAAYGEVYINTGSALVWNSTWSANIAKFGSYDGLDVGDINNDGRVDFVAIGWVAAVSSQVSYAYTNNGNTFARNTTWDANLLINGEYGGVSLVDLDGDGDLDLIKTGYESIGAASREFAAYTNTGNTFVTNASLTNNLRAESDGGFAVADYDNDGKFDVAAQEYDGASSYHELYNQTNGAFVTDHSYDSNFDDRWTNGGSVGMADINNDGALDMMVVGYNGTGTEYGEALAYDNMQSAKNVKPNPPTTFNSSYANGKLNLSWGKGTDDTDGPLFYNVRVGTSPGARDVVTEVFGQANGRAHAMGQHLGNVKSSRYIILNVTNQTYYWSVQTIDAGLRAGDWSSEQTYLPTYAVDWDAASESLADERNSSVTTNATVTATYAHANVNVVNVSGNGTGIIIAVPSSIGSLSNGESAQVMFNCTANDTLAPAVYLRTFRVSSTEDPAGDDIDVYCEVKPERLAYNVTWSQNLTGLIWSAAAWGDVDGDGDKDLAVAGQLYTVGTNVTRIYTNDGTTLTENATWEWNMTGYYRSSLSWVDLDNDGDLDLVGCGGVTGPDRNRTDIYINNGTSLVIDDVWNQNIDAGYEWCALSAADFNHDGYTDFVQIGRTINNDDTWNTRFTAWVNIEGRTIRANSSFDNFNRPDLAGQSAVYRYAGSVYAVDVNNDTWMDVGLMGWNSSTFSVPGMQMILLNNGSSLLNRTYQWNRDMWNGREGGMVFGDVNNDGRMDAISAGWNGTYNLTLVYINNGTSMVRNDSWRGDLNSLVGVEDECHALGDYDNDGKLDLLLIGYNNPNHYALLYKNNGTGFQNDTNYSSELLTTSTGSCGWADVDNDGDLDAMTMGYSPMIGNTYARIYENRRLTKNSPPGVPYDLYDNYNLTYNSFQVSWSPANDTETPSSGLYYNLRVGTCDGCNDIISGVYGDSSRYVQGQTFGNMQQGRKINISSVNLVYYWSVQAIDTGLEAGNWSTTRMFPVSVERFRRNDTWSEELSIVARGASAFGDVDNDGDLDLIHTGQNTYSSFMTNVSEIYINNGTTFVKNDTWGWNLTGVQWGAVAWGDIDNDGDLDLALAGLGDHTYKGLIYTNNGTSLVENRSWGGLSPQKWSTVTWADIDNDGRLDLFQQGGNSTGYYSYVFTNNGTLLRRNLTWDTGIAVVDEGDVSFGDIDKNGYVDLLQMGYSQSTGRHYTRVYTNNGATFANNATRTGDLGGNNGTDAGSLILGDVDNDGDLDAVRTGTNYGDTKSWSRYYTYNGTGFKYNNTVSAELYALHDGSAVFGDYNNDGKLDLIETGYNWSTNWNAEAYTFNGSRFVKNSNYSGSLYKVADGGNILLADIDNDNDLDAMETGDDGVAVQTKVLDNVRYNATPDNTPPSPPTALNNSYTGNRLRLIWGYGSDSQTPQKGLYYNIRVGTSPGANNIVSGKFGYKARTQSQSFGNMQNRMNISLAVPSQRYFWSVQTIDTSLAAGAWAEERGYEPTPSAPKYVNNNSNTTAPVEGDAVLLYANWTDDTSLDTALLATNESSTWGNKTSMNINLTADQTWSNFTWQNTSVLAGTVVAWRIYANDSMNSMNVTVNHTFTVQPAVVDTTKPTPIASGQNASTTTQFEALNLYANWTDDNSLGWAWLETNETGTWENKSAIDVNLVAGQTWSNFTWQNTSLAGSTVVSWRIYANDTTGNVNMTNRFNFTLQDSILINLNTSSVGFGEIAIGATNDTMDDNPLPFKIENTGNVRLNLTIEASSLWNSTANPTTNYQFKANVSVEGTPFNPDCTNQTWNNTPSVASKYVCFLNYTESSDMMETEIKITAPSGEPPGLKSSGITITASKA